MTAPAQHTPILSVLFIHESGYVESYRPDEIRAEPETFKAILAEHRTEGRKPLVMRQQGNCAAIAKAGGAA